jgi:hypothetical protein
MNLIPRIKIIHCPKVLTDISDLQGGLKSRPYEFNGSHECDPYKRTVSAFVTRPRILIFWKP